MKLGGKKSNTVQMRWEHDYQLIENEGLFDEYLEMGKCFFLEPCWIICWWLNTGRNNWNLLINHSKFQAINSFMPGIPYVESRDIE